jgi:hypothetical protein
MGKLLVKLETEHGSVLIESSISERSGTLQRADGINDIRKKLGDMLDVITSISEPIISSFNKLSRLPDSITAEGNLFVVKAAGEASLKLLLHGVQMRKKREQQEKQDVSEVEKEEVNTGKDGSES